MISIIREWLQTNCKAKSVPAYSMITLLKINTSMLVTGSIPLDALGIIRKEDQDDLRISYKLFLFSNIRRRLQKPDKLQKDNDEQCMSLYSTIDALETIDITPSELKDLQVKIRSFIATLKESKNKLAERLEMFIHEGQWDADGWPLSSFDGIVTSLEGRLAIQKRVLAMSGQMTDLEKLRIVHSLLKEVLPDGQSLAQLLAIRHFIDSCESRLAPSSSEIIADYH